jgi:hypothetical protein
MLVGSLSEMHNVIALKVSKDALSVSESTKVSYADGDQHAIMYHVGITHWAIPASVQLTLLAISVSVTATFSLRVS